VQSGAVLYCNSILSEYEVLEGMVVRVAEQVRGAGGNGCEEWQSRYEVLEGQPRL